MRIRRFGGLVHDANHNFTAAKPAQVGAITLARHGEPALSRKVKLDWKGYVEWWAAYEMVGLLEGQTPPPLLHELASQARYIYSSTLTRSVETAEAACQSHPFVQMPELVEAPLPPPHLPSWFRLTPNSWGWGFVARTWWWFGNGPKNQETRKQAQVRAREMAEFLTARAREGGDVLVLAHGYFNLMISLELKKMGFIKTLEQGFKYWGCRRYELRK